MTTPSSAISTAARARLVHILQCAYSGEQAAAFAYRGHWASVADAAERERIRTIEDEEWHHRALVGGILADLGAAPAGVRELRTWVIGRVLGVGCHLAGWFLPMWAAGKLERRNVGEYEEAAQAAIGCGREDLLDCLLTMAEVEWEHERYFRSRVSGHPWLKFFPLWPPLPPKEAIRGVYPLAAAPTAPPAATAAGPP